MWVLCALIAVAVVAWNVYSQHQMPHKKRKLSDSVEIHDVELGNAPPPEPPLRERRKPTIVL